MRSLKLDLEGRCGVSGDATNLRKRGGLGVIIETLRIKRGGLQTQYLGVLPFITLLPLTTDGLYSFASGLSWKHSAICPRSWAIQGGVIEVSVGFHWCWYGDVSP